MDKERKWLYYYYIMAKKSQGTNRRKGKGKDHGDKPRTSVHIDFPDDFVSVLEARKARGKK